jgi:hypothetical protein
MSRRRAWYHIVMLAIAFIFWGVALADAYFAMITGRLAWLP